MAIALNTTQPLVPLPNAVNTAEGTIPSSQFCHGVVALEEQLLFSYNFISFSHQKGCFKTSLFKWVISD